MLKYTFFFLSLFLLSIVQGSAKGSWLLGLLGEVDVKPQDPHAPGVEG